MKMKYTNKILPAGIIGQNKYYILSGKPTDNPNVSVYLLNVLDSDQEADYSLWNFEILNEHDVRVWPYKGEDYEKLMLELGEDFVEHAFS